MGEETHGGQRVEEQEMEKLPGSVGAPELCRPPCWWPQRASSSSGVRPVDGLLLGLLIGSLVHSDNDTSCQLIAAKMKSAPHIRGQRVTEDFLFGE